MIKNKVFILFRMKLLIITLFFLFIPFLFSANASSLDNNRYINLFTNSNVNNIVISNEYIIHGNDEYLPTCDPDSITTETPNWTTYPYKNSVPSNVTCLQKPYCSDLDENGELIVKTPGLDEYRNPNCYKKSCLDLTTEELKAIFKQQYGMDADTYFNSGNSSNATIGFYKYCEPYIYTTQSVNGITAPVIQTDQPIYCHYFKKDELKYLIPNIRNIKDSATGQTDVYQCLLHECPLTTNQSLLCPTNFWLFSYKENNERIRSDNYIEEYEDKLLGGSETIVGSKIQNYCTTIICNKYKYKKQLDCQLNINDACTQCINKIAATNCGDDCYEEVLSIPECNGCYSFTLNSQCDTYKDLDKSFANYTKYNNLINTLSYYNNGVQVCNSDLTCQQTIDCTLAENSNNTLCFSQNISSDAPDQFLSYFYRPFPSLDSTEVLPVELEWIENNTVAENIYSDTYNSETIKNKANNGTPISYVTVVRRSMLGSPIKPTPSSKNYYLDSNHLITNYNTINDYPINLFRNLTQTNISNNTRDNICIPSDQDFKKYIPKKTQLMGNSSKTWNEGEYYISKNLGVTFEMVSEVHNTPLCDPNKNKTVTTSVNGRSAFCTHNNKDEACITPKSDSYYIKGLPSFEWKSGTSKIKSVSVEACLRVRSPHKSTVSSSTTNSSATKINTYNPCGERECFTECTNLSCAQLKQTCSYDKCVVLTWNDGDDCSLKALENPDNKATSCFKEIFDNRSKTKNDVIRFRLNKINDKFYVFIDAGNKSWCSENDNDHIKAVKHAQTMKPLVEKDYITTNTITEYRGRLNEQNLVDDNSLTDNDGDDYITDKDVFGEELYELYHCSAPSETQKYKCSANSTNEYEGAGNWIVWDIVPYIGNNQPTNNNPNCKVGQIKNCRGYYDAEGNFYKEQQAIIPPLAASPNFFYRYATKENSRNMFVPLLKILSATTYDGQQHRLNNSDDDDKIELDFFEPNVKVGLNLAELDVTVEFSNMSKKDYITDIINNFTQDFVIKKRVITDNAIIPQVCIAKIISADGIIDENGNNLTQEEIVKCLRRRHPDLNSIVIKSYAGDSSTNPYLNTYFINTKEINKQSSIPINSKNVIQFENRDDSLNQNEKYRLYNKSTGLAQEYPINVEKSYCTYINYECIDYKNELVQKTKQLDNLISENNTSNTIDVLKSQIIQLQNNIDSCENTIQTYCDNLYGGVFFVKKIGCKDDCNAFNTYMDNLIDIRNCLLSENGCSNNLQEIINDFHDFLLNGKNSTIITKVPKNYNLIGSTSDICITSGFENYFPYVMAHQSINERVLGKCVLNTESKNKASCRREYYYSFCTDNNDEDCLCIDGTAECNCSYGNTCVKKNSCECSDNEGDISCDNLPEECYLPGYNGYGIVLNSGNVVDTICECEYNTDGLARSGMEIRQATARELGLCADINNTNFCQAVKYYDENKNYLDGGAGKKLDIIQSQYKSNIWRTQQKQYGKVQNNNLEHAEFDTTVYNNGKIYKINNVYCVDLKNNGYYYYSLTGDCHEGYAKKYAVEGQCNGFWKNKKITDGLNNFYELNPLAVCKNDGTFELIQNSGCERYSCPETIETNSNYATQDEKTSTIGTELSNSTVNYKGLSNGFANWKEYKKGTYNFINDTTLTDGTENGHGDDIEQIIASSCITGYAPAGFGQILKRYYPVALKNITDKDTNESIYVKDDNVILDVFINNMLLNNTNYVSEENMLSTLIYSSGAYQPTLSYDAREHLPTRYCNQIGQWLPVDDIYTRFGVPLYYINNLAFHNQNDIFVNLNQYNITGKSLTETNTYGELINYSQKYCERLFCDAINHEDIIPIEDEEKDDLTTANSYNSTFDIRYFNNLNDINKYTVWRHAGGAIWSETPAPLDGISKTIVGTCDSLNSYYPMNSEFILDIILPYGQTYSSFEKQYNELFSQQNVGTTVDPRTLTMITNNSTNIKPTRKCNKYGIWEEIDNKCVKACEPLDPFRTNFTYTGDGNDLKVSVNNLYKVPHYRNNYYKESKTNNLKYGDKYTGGAKWGRTLAGQYAIGECDSTIKNGTQIYRNNNLVVSNENIVFINGGDIDNGMGGRPYRECLPDGTWGPVHDPCILYDNICSDKNIYNGNISNSLIESSNIIGVLNSSSIIYDDIQDSQNILIEVETSCEPKYYTGKVSQQCDITTQQWTGQLTSTCEPKTCDAYSESVNDIEFVSIPANKYYMKDTGFTGQLTLNNNTYIDYKVNQTCPEYYECKNCTNNAVQYICEYNEDTSQPQWNSIGECEPISCDAYALQQKCELYGNCVVDTELNENSIIETPVDSPLNIVDTLTNIVYKSSGNKYDSTQNRFATGTHIKIYPKLGLKESDKLSSYAYCDTYGNWQLVENFEPVKCNENDLIIEDDKAWINKTTGKCYDNTESYDCPGAIKTAYCNDGDTPNKQTATCTLNKDKTATWVYSGELSCYKDCNYPTVNISINNQSCYCPTISPITFEECSNDAPVCVDINNKDYQLNTIIKHGEVKNITISNTNQEVSAVATISLECDNGIIRQINRDNIQMNCKCFNGCESYYKKSLCNN